MRYARILWLLVGLIPLPTSAQPTVVDSLGTALASDHDGAVVIGVLAGDSTATDGFGAIDSTGARPTARTLFEIGSVTKTFTGLLLADAIERGRVEASTPVAGLLPDSVALGPADSTTMTLEHLATHRSGLPRLPANLDVAARPTDPYAAYGDSALFAFLEGYTPPRPPETQYEYSNLGMGLLGHLLARRADTTYAALVQKRIAGPLGLPDTRVRLTDARQARLAQGHNRAGAPTSPWHFEALAGAGALRSTATDMLAYLRAHRRPLQTTSDTASTLHRAMQRAVAPRASTGREETRIGYGWHRSTRDGHAVLWHTGGTGGFRSFVGLDRETGRGVVVLVSSAVASRSVAAGGFRLLEMARTE